MLHTPVDPYRRSYTTSRCSSTSKSIPLTSSSSSLPTYFSSSSPFDRYPPPPLCSLDVSNRLSRFLAYYLTSYLPRTLFIHHFSRSAITTTCATPFKVVSTPDSSPSATPPSSKQFFWIRAPALLPTTIDPRESIPALPALFDSFESPVIELAGDVWHFEKIGPELDQSFWHLHLAGEETFAIKVVFDQAYGGLGS
ncbi:uncharacterized protein JCM6883_007340 [Sporobolomyces salmoneus]|uniref:uncharacterized protein n=1 Tax=Sporobolomyces salmoneus TaxID=183962 RepID=UPI0031799B86